MCELNQVFGNLKIKLNDYLESVRHVYQQESSKPLSSKHEGDFLGQALSNFHASKAKQSFESDFCVLFSHDDFKVALSRNQELQVRVVDLFFDLKESLNSSPLDQGFVDDMYSMIKDLLCKAVLVCHRCDDLSTKKNQDYLVQLTFQLQEDDLATLSKSQLMEYVTRAPAPSRDSKLAGSGGGGGGATGYTLGEVVNGESSVSGKVTPVSGYHFSGAAALDPGQFRGGAAEAQETLGGSKNKYLKGIRLVFEGDDGDQERALREHQESLARR